MLSLIQLVQLANVKPGNEIVGQIQKGINKPM